MALDASEAKVLKAICSMFSHDLLGLSIHDKSETSHHSQFRWEDLATDFRFKCVDSPFCESMCAAFRKTHDYKYIDHPTFKIAMEVDMRSMGLPNHVREEALKYVDDLINELSETKFSERDAGWGDIEGARDVTTYATCRTPKSEEPHTGGGPNPSGDKRKLQMESINEMDDLGKKVSGRADVWAGQGAIDKSMRTQKTAKTCPGCKRGSLAKADAGGRARYECDTCGSVYSPKSVGEGRWRWSLIKEGGMRRISKAPMCKACGDLMQVKKKKGKKPGELRPNYKAGWECRKCGLDEKKGKAGGSAYGT